MAFTTPLVAANSDTWGPPLKQDEFANFASLPFQNFGRNDRLGRAADFTSSTR